MNLSAYNLRQTYINGDVSEWVSEWCVCVCAHAEIIYRKCLFIWNFNWIACLWCMIKGSSFRIGSWQFLILFLSLFIFIHVIMHIQSATQSHCLRYNRIIMFNYLKNIQQQIVSVCFPVRVSEWVEWVCVCPMLKLIWNGWRNEKLLSQKYENDCEQRASKESQESRKTVINIFFYSAAMCTSLCVYVTNRNQKPQGTRNIYDIKCSFIQL